MILSIITGRILVLKQGIAVLQIFPWEPISGSVITFGNDDPNNQKIQISFCFSDGVMMQLTPIPPLRIWSTYSRSTSYQQLVNMGCQKFQTKNNHKFTNKFIFVVKNERNGTER